MAHLPPHDADDYMRQYLARADLTALDLQDIDLQADVAAERLWHWCRLALSGIATALVVWAMNTDFYQFHGHGTWLVPVAWGALFATVAAVVQAMWALRQGGQIPAGAAALANSRAQVSFQPGPAPQWWPALRLSARAQRYGLLLVGLGLGGGVLYYLPRDAEWQGNGYSSSWFLGVGAALVAGISLGRWLIAQADAPPLAAPVPSTEPFVWPAWMKWATLALLIGGGLFATFGHLLLNAGDSSTVSFELSSVGLAVGIFAAIWIARRFDEWEADFRDTGKPKLPRNER